MSKLLARYASLESDVSDVPVVNDEVDETGAQLDGTEIAEGDMLEAEEHLGDVDQAEGEAEELTQTTEALESWLDHVGAARRNRTGLTKREAHGIFVGLNNDMRRHGHTVDDLVDGHNVAVESFDGGRDSVSRCLSLENAIMEAIKSFWQKIKDTISKMVKAVREWYLKHLDSASRMKKRAEALRDKANQTSGTAKEKKINLTVHRQLSNKKAAGDANFISSGLKTCAQALDSLTTKRISSAGDTLDAIETAVNTIIDSPNATTASAIDASDYTLDTTIAGTSAQTSYAKLLGLEGVSNASVYGTGDLPGHKAIMGASFTISATDALEKADEIKQAEDRSKIHVKFTTDKIPEIESSKEYPTLAPSVCGSLCSDVIKLLDVIVNYRANFDKYESSTKKFLAKMDTIYKKNIKEDTDVARDNAKIGRLLGGAGASSIRSLNASITALSGYSMGLCRATLVYAQQSLAQHKA